MPRLNGLVIGPTVGGGELKNIFLQIKGLREDLGIFTRIPADPLKRRESISGRLGDVLSQMYLISAVLKRFEDEGRSPEDTPYVHWCVQDALYQAQQAMLGVLDNFPSRSMAALLRLVIFPFGARHRAPRDVLGRQVANAMQTAGVARERLLADTYFQIDTDDVISSCEHALRLLPEFKAIELRLKEPIKAGRLEPIPSSLASMHDWVLRALVSGMLSTEERRLMLDYTRLVNNAIVVDDFPKDFGIKNRPVEPWRESQEVI